MKSHFYNRKKAAFNGIFILLAGLFPTTFWAQNSSAWILPKHQFQVQIGTGAIAGVHPASYPSSSSIVGLAYNFNATKNVFASFDFQSMGNSTDLFSFSPPTNEVPRKVQVFNFKDLGESFSNEINTNNTLFALTNNDGFIRRQNYNLSAGYMTVTARNIFRVGVGCSYSAYQARRAESKFTNLGRVDYLYIYDGALLLVNLTVSYDFFITQNWTIGLRSNYLFQRTFMPFGAGLTVGYAPFFNCQKKIKVQPRV